MYLKKSLHGLHIRSTLSLTSLIQSRFLIFFYFKLFMFIILFYIYFVFNGYIFNLFLYCIQPSDMLLLSYFHVLLPTWQISKTIQIVYILCTEATKCHHFSIVSNFFFCHYNSMFINSVVTMPSRVVFLLRLLLFFDNYNWGTRTSEYTAGY